ncbi:hypothetical protein AB4037_33840 [Labrys sp. KB_33_2]|uniref:hypothetical protein n=1 Tax=Labrys sp. KB_33_2 TaxID=3237479 RepID=UPI003F90E058
MAVLVSRRATTDIRAMSVEAAIIRAQTASEAGLARAVASLDDRNDRFGLTPYTGDVTWEFDGAQIRLRMEAESGKLDVLRADLALLRYVVGRLVVDPSDQALVLDQIQKLRSRNLTPYDLRAILPAKLRVSNLASAFEPHLTALVSQSGVDPIGASSLVREALLAEHPQLRDAMNQSLKWRQVTPELAAGLGAQYSLPSNLFTIDAQASLPNGIRARRRALVSLDFSSHRAYLLRDTQVSPEQAE